MDRKRGTTGQSPSPFLARFHADIFMASMALAGQAVLWRTMNSISFYDPWPPIFNSVVERYSWLLAALALSSSFLLYILKYIFYSNIVKVDFLHPFWVNYLFTPWISAILLLRCILIPASIQDRYWRLGIRLEGTNFFNWVHLGRVISMALWGSFTLPVLLLQFNIYGQSFTKDKQILAAIATPSTHLSMIGHFAAAQTAADLSLPQISLFLFSIGIMHCVVVFIALYQRLSSVRSITIQLRPASFLSIAAPSVASVAWESISGYFGAGCKMLYFLSLFLFTSLMVTPPLFQNSMKKFSFAWWAYSFPVTMLALSSASYAKATDTVLAHQIRRVLSMASLFVTLVLLLLSIVFGKAGSSPQVPLLLPQSAQAVALPPHPLVLPVLRRKRGVSLASLSMFNLPPLEE
ncbi:S-type anion channel SLAH4-like [Nymphaea colorata]|uniref:S-type anion channel SLAH4-like n=1 Tax=Nymphaea colorata TaxID=210225 RepID=UPI00129D432E|nr:S-type anion channel SLAH4-like [Nymphaea colorata]